MVLVTQAAVSVRDAAGAVREVAQNILKVKHLPCYVVGKIIMTMPCRPVPLIIVKLLGLPIAITIT